MRKLTTLKEDTLEVSYDKELTFKKLAKFFKEIGFNKKVNVANEECTFHHSMPIAEDICINVIIDDEDIAKNIYGIYVVSYYNLIPMLDGLAFHIPKEHEKEEMKRPLTLLIETTRIPSEVDLEDYLTEKYDDKYSIITDTKAFLELILSDVRKQIKLSINK